METITLDRAGAERFGLDVEGLRRGLYTDAYFLNVRRVLETAAREGLTYAGLRPGFDARGTDLSRVAVGDIIADMQVFARRAPFCIAAGVEVALAILALATGESDADGRFVETADRLEVRAVPDGTRLAPWQPALRIMGRYRDYGILETTILGVLTRMSLVATNTYRFLESAGGRPLFFFPARFDVYGTQAFDGLAYKIGVEAYNRDHAANAPVLISTDAQGQFFGGRGAGTMSHSYLVCFLKDTAEATLHFARVLPPEVRRIALVDVNNDCVGDALATARAMFGRFKELLIEGREDEARKYVLYGVRADTPGEQRDVSVAPLGDEELDCGVCARLVWQLREALDRLAEDPNIEDSWREQAREYFRNVKIVVSGGFTAERAARFTRLGVPADIYGVGSWFFRGGHNDYTADLVRVQIDGAGRDMAKTGRRPMENPDLREVRFEGFGGNASPSTK